MSCFAVVSAVQQIWTTFGGVVLGGALTTFTSWWTLRRQYAADLERERRAREEVASQKAAEALIRLMLQPKKPGSDESGEDVDAYWRERYNALLIFETAVLDLRDPYLRDRLMAAQKSMMGELWALDGRTEIEMRQGACRDALDSLGRFRRGEGLTLRPPTPFWAPMPPSAARDKGRDR